MIPKLLAVTALALVIGLAPKTSRPSAAARPIELKCAWVADTPRTSQDDLVCSSIQRFMVTGDSTGTDGGRSLRDVRATYAIESLRLTNLVWASDSMRAGRRELVAPLSGQLRVTVDYDTLAVGAIRFRGPEGRHVR